MPEAPRVSVLMTAYNRADYIAAAIESVLRQSFTDFELVIVDDRSTDDTVAIARRYEQADARVRVLVNERNRGDYPNRNHALTAARGELVKYHDSDDVMYGHCLDVLVRCLAQAPEASLALSAARSWAGGPFPVVSTPHQIYQREYLGYESVFSQGPGNALFRTAALRRLGGFPEAGPHSDRLFWIRAFRTETVVLTPTDLYWYRIHDGQHLRSEGAAYDWLAVLPEIWASLDHPDCPLTAAERATAKRNLAYGWARDSLFDLRGGRYRLAAARLRAPRLSWSEWLRHLRRPVRSSRAGIPPASASGVC